MVLLHAGEDLTSQEENYIRFEQLYDWTSASIEAQIMDHQHPPPHPQVIVHQQPLKAPFPTFDDQRIIVETHIRGILSLRKMTSESHKELRNLIDECTKHVECLEYLQQELSGVSELMVVFLLTSALDPSTRKVWEQSLQSGELPKYRSTIAFLKSQCQVLERCESVCPITMPKPSTTKQAQPKVPNQRSYAATAAFDKPSIQCAFCDGPHRNFQCNKLSILPSAERMEKVRASGVCYNCLTKGHRSKDCPSTKNCQKCGKRHHTQLHEEQQQQPKPMATPTTTNLLLLTAVVHVLNNDNQPQTCRVLLDSGSQVNFITDQLANTLRLEKRKVEVPIGGINGIKTVARHLIKVHLQSRCSDFRTELECLVIPKVTGPIPSTNIDITDWHFPHGIQLADPNFFKPDKIDLLVGAALFFNIVKTGHLILDPCLPELRESYLGWLVTGTLTSKSNYEPIQYAQLASVESIENSITRFWELEEVPTAPKTTAEEQQCEEHFVATHTRDVSGRYTVRLPLKPNADKLDSCRNLALKRFFMLENRLQRNPELWSQYVEFIREYQLLGHCQTINEADDPPQRGKYYLPHHAVLRPSSTTTKCRVVFDGSAKSSPSGLSLNNVLTVGPVVQNDLFSIMLRFRKHRYVFTADIAKMYRQVRVHTDDTGYQRIFWRENPKHPLQVLELTTVTYGTASAPFPATRCLIQLADDEGDKFPKAANILRHDCYVDDIMSGSDNIDEVIEIQRQLKAILLKGGFPVHKWCSNSTQLLEHIPVNEQETTKRYDEFDINEAIKVLGVLWVPSTDQLLIARCTSPTVNEKQPSTKRIVCSEIAKLFDPLGLISPTIVIAKLLVQQLWRKKLDWDDHLDNDSLKHWNELRESLSHLNEIAIPRQVTFNDAVVYELHGFADASMVAYGACVYIRSIFPDGSCKVRLLSSKSKVAPLHELSIPRKELCAAVLLVKLVTKIVSFIDINFRQVLLWSDSQIVLAWIKKHPDRLEIFVRNRIAEINLHTQQKQWHYVPSQFNPADIVSRGQLPFPLSQNTTWWEGPQFLTEATFIEERPEDIPDDELPELKVNLVTTLATNQKPLDVFTDVSCFRRLQRIIAWVLRYLNNRRKPKEERVLHPHLTIDELRNSMLVIVRVIQRLEFDDEIKRVQKGVPCKRLAALNPILSDGLLRVGGRLRHSNLPDESKHQLILPNNNSVTKLLVRALHLELLHVGPSGLISALRQRFWLLNARSTVRNVTRQCIKCFRVNPTNVQQLMGELPKQRVVLSSPFNITGVDYAGPIQVKQGKYRPKVVKAYVSVFVCMATKAIHLELVSDLTTDAFIAALERFISRRGMVAELHSDNATNFKGASNELHQLYQQFQEQQQANRIERYCQSKEIAWHFIPPNAPEFGGLWEAAVKSTKYHLKRIIGTTLLSFEEMATLLCKIEAILNSRPLYAVSNDPADPEVISPAHFLIGRPLTAPSGPTYCDEKIGRLNRWQHIQLMREHFWRAWSRDYLSSLQVRKKNTSVQDNIKPGMIVILHDNNRPPLEWKLGRITAVFPGDDNLVRAVDVFSEGSTYRRAITKISLLPIEDNKSPLPAGICSVSDNLPARKKST
ncbi:uncharacterized protein LOC129737707 [Uranotaenia lowii]|uniref:uncharacterized protein LOC129737707 n=1 Tax=Uranotaenia lowii TaxID=190385 RepID=UPI00247A67D7|nr:uncharacterized protein LOC129737707 [Uranotaenia lowii]